MREDTPDPSISPSNSERRFPNEIFAIIIDDLNDDLPSLRATALVCKDFVGLSQRHIFRTIDVTSTHSQTSEQVHRSASECMNRLSTLLRDPQSVSLGRFVQSFHFYVPSGLPIFRTTEILTHSLQNMPSLAELRLTSPGPEHFQVIQERCPHALKELSIISPLPQDLQAFQNMLASMPNLEFLAMLDWRVPFWQQVLKPIILILPSSLREVNFGRVDPIMLEAVAHGMSILYPQMLSTIFLQLYPAWGFRGIGALWERLQIDTSVVLDVQSRSYFIPEPHHFIANRVLSAIVNDTIGIMLGFTAPKVILRCFQTHGLVMFITKFISNLPHSVLKVLIALANDGPINPRLKLEDWATLDEVLMQRHEQGLLESVSFGRPSILAMDTISLDMFNDIPSLLPRSEMADILKVDTAMEVGVPRAYGTA
ncbi:hypothetical protein BT96DRAFT_981624 [Gymnopus androsaceus JB14]|uniref:F-box domain-containing protein n=1 Tax=Gymnopus androsaceus JB14 TaxID=1447944 RepID=A0A6A4GN57_9AGAR|nr:hypothetical protein BT96DRAFT_981624 [Gymnopus androsaceus JB14]